jgi:hypothetical protein
MHLKQAPTYYICFCNTDRWHKKMLRKGFSHCFILINDGINWIELSPTLRQLIVEIIPIAGDEDATLIYLRKIFPLTILKVEMCGKPMKGLLRLPTCVSFIKYLLGINMWCFTPYKLFNKLLSLSTLKKSKFMIKEIRCLNRNSPKGKVDRFHCYNQKSRV